jgi:hypothetical protein
MLAIGAAGHTPDTAAHVAVETAKTAAVETPHTNGRILAHSDKGVW